MIAAMSSAGKADVIAERWLDDREQAAWRAFLSVQARLNAQLGRELQEEFGLSSADFAVLVNLSERDGQQMRIMELARALQWEKSRLSHQLTRMEQRGLLQRSNCDEDRRGAFVLLTAPGRSAVEAAAPRHVAAVRRYLFDEISADQVDALATICRSVLAKLEAGCIESGAGCADPTAGCDEADDLTPG